MKSGGDREILNYKISHVRNTNIPLFWRTVHTQHSLTPLAGRVAGGHDPTQHQEKEGAGRNSNLEEATWTFAVDLKGTEMYPES